MNKKKRNTMEKNETIQFSNKVDRDYVFCIICYEIPKEQGIHCVNGHLTCCGCLNKTITGAGNICAYCRKKGSDYFTFDRSILENLITISCNKCDEQILLKNYEDHGIMCGIEDCVKCPLFYYKILKKNQ